MEGHERVEATLHDLFPVDPPEIIEVGVDREPENAACKEHDRAGNSIVLVHRGHCAERQGAVKVVYEFPGIGVAKRDHRQRTVFLGEWDLTVGAVVILLPPEEARIGNVRHHGQGWLRQ